MKKLNLIKRLLSYSHEKQKPQRFGRYAVMLMMLLTLGVGQMWARTYDGTEKLYIKNIKPGSWGKHWINGDNQVLWVQFDGNSSTNTAATYISGSGTLYSDSYYELTVPSGTYTNIVIYRGASLGSSWNNTGSISLNSTANVIDGGYSEGETGASWNTFLDVTTSTVLYFKIGSWWYNEGCNHYIEFYTIDGSTQTLPAYDLASYLSNNATTSTTSSTSNDKIFVTLPTGVYKSYKLDRKKSDSASGENHNQSSECSFSSSTGKNQVGTMTNGGAISTWDTNKPSSAGSVTPSSSSVSLNTAVTMTPSLTSNTLLNNLKSTAYGVSPGTSGTDWTMVGNVFTPLKAGTYTITATITYNAKGFPDLTTTVTPTTTVTAYATITLDKNGGTANGSAVFAPNATSYTSITHATYVGGILEGYYDDNVYTTKVLNADGSFAATNVTGYITDGKWTCSTNTTLYAKWTPYTITEASMSPSTIPISTNTDITFSFKTNAPTGQGYQFRIKEFTPSANPYGAGYEANGQTVAYSAPTAQTYTRTNVNRTAGTYKTQIEVYKDAWYVGTSDLTLTVAAAIEYYTVTFGKSGDGSISASAGGSPISTGASIADGTTVTFTAVPDSEHKVEGWYTNADCTTGKHDAGNTEYSQSITANANVYVKFIEKSRYSISFDYADGCSNTMGDISANDNTATDDIESRDNVYEDHSITLTATENSGYKFIGWYDSSDNLLSNNKSWTFTHSATVSAYAKWIEARDITIYMYNSDPTDMGTNQIRIDVTPYLGEVAQTPLSNQAMTLSSDGLWYYYTVENVTSVKVVYVYWANGGHTDNDLRNETFTDDIYIYQSGDATTSYLLNTNTVSVGTAGTGGSVSPNGTVIVPETNTPGQYVSLTATPGTNATFTGWNLSGNVEIVSGSTSSSTISIKSTGTGGVVTANFSRYYVEGRFSCRSEANGSLNKHVGGSNGIWATESKDIPLSYNSSKSAYELHTYLTFKDLKTGQDDHYIRIGYYNGSGWTQYQLGSDNKKLIMSEAGDSYKISMATSGDRSLYFDRDETNDAKWIILYFDAANTKFWFELEDIPAAIDEVDLSVTRVPPTAPITATPNMYYKGATNKAYCWGVYTDEECTSKVNSVTFSSLGDGKVQFMAPQTRGTYYLKLTVHSSDDCNAAIDDEEVVSFTVTTDDMVFFKNVPGWGNVHFYFLGAAYWSETLGSGCAGRDGGAARGMTRIGNSDIYYYDYSNNSVMTTYLSSHSTCYIAFTDNYKPNSNNFSGCQAAYRGDFSECATMYVPENYITHYKNTGAGDGQCAYYNRGYWTKYMDSGSAYTLHVYDAKDGGTEVFSHEFTGTAGVNTYSYTHDFKDVSQSMPYVYYVTLVGCNGSTYGSADDMDISKCTNWNFYTDTRRCGLKVQAKLKHTFILTLTGDGHIQLSVEYPISVGDYRLLYDDDTQNPHPSQFIRKRTHDTDTVFKDTVSMYIRPSATETLKVQTCTGISGETITWADYNWTGSDATGAINVSSKTDGVYNFYLEQDKTGKLTVNTTETKPYTGRYYIRTNGVDGGWNSYKTSSDNLMTYAQYPEDKGYGFNYYKAKWVGTTGTDVTYTIACDYSPSLCDTLTADPDNNPLSASEAASLPHTANIRFGWHSKTNQLKREYINGSTNVSDRFLVMMGDTKLMNPDETPLAISGLNANEISFTDLNNWIYRCDVKAKEGAAVKLQATYDGHEQYFIGGADKTEEIIGGSGEDSYVMRVTYDFKTNRLMTAWLPNGTAITSDVELNADMMLIREGQNAATQVYFNSSGKSISEIHTIYGVMEFQYDHMVGKFPNWNADGAYEYLMYYISFPFDVKVSEIFGCGVRGENWIIQKYNGAKRAQIGWFAETSTFWETMEGNETMNAYEGYLLLLDRVTFNDPSSSLWYKQGSGNSIYLYFPSKSVASGTISEDYTTIHVPEHTCTINRTFTVPNVGEVNHKNTDSHWNIMGTPLFENKTASTVTTGPTAGVETLQYYYAWNKEDNTLSARSALSTSTEFKSMHAYMVQYAGDVTFRGAKLTPPPASVAARRIPSDKNYRIELQMVNANGKSSETFVELRENACDTFALNEDMYMVRSSKMVDLYTFAGAYDVAANVLSVNNHIVPVGMDVKQAGTYRFTMPSDFSGTVTLIDTQAGARTNLALGDYEVNLEKGTLNNRFQLEINIQASTTSLEGNDVKDGGAHKFIENGAMYILKNGEIFDVYGNHVR